MSKVSHLARNLDGVVEAFRPRPLDAGPYTYLWLDALTEKVPSVSPADIAGFRMVGGWVGRHPLATIPAVLGVLVSSPQARLARVARPMRSGATRSPSPYLGGFPSSPRRPHGEGESRHIMCLR
jgi:hypothetical protein